MQYKVGIGYDIHRLVRGRKLFLGAVEIPYAKGLLGHSDGDVLLHALIDALLGALGAGDIGEHFPDSDPQYQGMASSLLVSKVRQLIDRSGYRINNLDAIIIAQQPKLTPFKQQIKEKICALLNLRPEILNIKAKTNEGLGPLGRGQGISSWVSVSLIKGD